MAELSGPESGGQVLDQAVSGQDQAGGADTGDPARARIGEGGDSRGSGREPGPAETSTREQYADEMRSGPSAEHDGAAGYEDDTDRKDAPASASTAGGELAEPRSRAETASEARAAADLPRDQHRADVITSDDQSQAGLDAPAGTQAPDTEHLAEPRSRSEIADEARIRPVRDEYLPSLDGSRAPAETRDGQGGAPRPEHAGRHDGPDRRFTVVQADRTLGDTTPTGIGLKPAGEGLRDMESDKLSRAARFRREFYREAEDIQDISEKSANELKVLLGPHPAGHSEATTTQPAIEAPPPQPLDAGSIATAGLVVGLLADRAIQWAREWRSDRRDKR